MKSASTCPSPWVLTATRRQRLWRLLAPAFSLALVMGLVAGLAVRTTSSLAQPLRHAALAGAGNGGIGESELFGGGNPAERCKACSIQSALGSQLGGQSVQPGQDYNPLNGDYTTQNSLFSIPTIGGNMGISLTYDAQLAEAEQATNSPQYEGFGYGWSSTMQASTYSDPSGNVTVNEGNGSTVTFSPFNPAPMPGTSSYAAPAAAEDQATGNIYVAAEGANNTLNAYWYINSVHQWYGPLQLGGTGTTYAVSIAIGSTGLPTIAAWGPNYSLYVYWEASNAQWYGPLQVGSANSTYSAPSVAVGSSGLPTVAVDGPSGVLYVYWEASNAQWYGPLQPGTNGGGAPAYSAPTISDSMISGLPTIATEGPSNSLYVYWQSADAQWHGPYQVGGGGTTYQVPAIADEYSSGLPTVAAQGPNNTLNVSWEDASAQWHGPLQVGGSNSTYDTGLSVGGGNLPYVAVEGPSNSLDVYWEDSSANWHGPLMLAGPSTTYSPPSMVANGNTVAMDVFAQGPGNLIYHYGYDYSQLTQSWSWNGDCPSGGGSPTQFTGNGSSTQYCAPARAAARLALLNAGTTYQFSTDDGQLVETFAASTGEISKIGNAQTTNAIQAAWGVTPGASGCPTSSGTTSCTTWFDSALREDVVAYVGQLVTQLIDPANRTYVFNYDGSADLAQVIEPNSTSQWNYSYLTGNTQPFNHELGRIEDPNNDITTLAYTPGGNIETISDPLGDATNLSYSIDGCYNTTTNPCSGNGDNQTTTVSFQDGEKDVDAYSGGLPTQLQSGSPTSTSSYYYGNHVWNLTYTYASNQGPSTAVVQLNSGPTTTFSFDLAGNIQKVTDIAGNTTTNFWNDDGSGMDELCWSAPPGATIPALGSCSAPPSGATSYAYDQFGNVVSVTDPVGNTTNYGYNSVNELCFMAPPGVSVSGATCSVPPAGSTLYTYDGQGDLTETQPDHGTSGETTTESSYNVDGVETANWPADAFAMGTNPGTANNAYETTNAVDPTMEWINSTTGPLSRTTSYIHRDAMGRVIETQDPTGYTAQQYDALGRVCWSERLTSALTPPFAPCSQPPSGETTVTTYSYGHSVPLTVKTPNGNTTFYAYGDPQFPTKATQVTDPASTNIQYTAYDGFGNACISGPVNPFDAGGFNSCASAISGDTFTQTDQLGRTTKQTDQSGNTTTYGYSDAAYDTQATSETSPLGITSTAYDADGRPTSVTQPNGTVLSTGYDTRSRKCWTAPFSSLASCAAPPTGAGVSVFSYNTAQHLASMTDNNGDISAPLQAITTYSYDNDGKLLSETNDNGLQVLYSYDVAGELTCIGYPVKSGANCANTPSSTNSVVDRTYDTSGRLASTADWLGNTTVYGYSSDGENRLTSITYPTSTGEAASYGYDLDGNLTSNSYSGPAVGAQNQTWGYNADDLQSSTSQLGGFSSPYSYYAYNRLKTGTVPGNASGDTYSYNANGELASDTQPNGNATTYSYNTADELSQMSSSASPSGNISAVGSLASTFGTGGTTLSVSPQTAGDAFVLAVQVNSSSVSVSSVSGGGANWSKLTSASDSTQNRDVELWLGTISTTGSSTITVGFSGSVSGINTEFNAQEYTAGTGASTIWSKDKTGSSANDTASTTVTFPTLTPSTTKELYVGYARTPQPSSGGGTTGFTYDIDGNGNMYVFNPSVSSAVAPAATQSPADLSLTAGALITASVPGSSSTQFAWDLVGGGSTPLVLFDGTNAYVYGPLLFGGTAPVEQINLSTSQASYLSAVPAGVQLVFNQSGTLQNRASYSPFGTQTNTAPSSPTPFGFQGGYSDPSGLIYLVHRYYDPATGQFLSVDPLVDQTGQPYAYAGDNPINVSDPLGLRGWYCIHNQTHYYKGNKYGNVGNGKCPPSSSDNVPIPIIRRWAPPPVAVVKGISNESSLSLKVEATGKGFTIGIADYLESPDTSFNICPVDAFRSSGCQGATLVGHQAYTATIPIADRSGWDFARNETPTYNLTITANVDPIWEALGGILGVDGATPDPLYVIGTSANVTYFTGK